jgi:signal peptidase I
MKQNPDQNASLPEPYLTTALDLLRHSGQAQWLPVTGRSMMPLIWPGDEVLVTADWQAAKRGDILTFLQDGQLNTHRLLRMTNVGGQMICTTKGDNLWQPDPPLAATAVIGQVIAVRRGKKVWSENGRWRGRLWRLGNLYLTHLMGWQTDLYAWLNPLRQIGPVRWLIRPFLLLSRALRYLSWWLFRRLTGRP